MEGKWSKMEEIWRKSYPHCSPLLMVGVQLHREHMRVLSYLAKMKILQTENEEFHSKMGKHRRVGETQAGWGNTGGLYQQSPTQLRYIRRLKNTASISALQDSTIFNTKFIILNTKFTILNTKFIILNTKFMDFNRKIATRRPSAAHRCTLSARHARSTGPCSPCAGRARASRPVCETYQSQFCKTVAKTIGGGDEGNALAET